MFFLNKAMNAFFFQACLLSFFISFNVKAQSDDNIVISKKNITFEFVKGTNANPVLIKEVLHKQYLCNNFRTNIPYIEFYNDNVSIDQVKVYVDGKRAAITPKYDFYEVEDVFYSDMRVCYFNLPFEKRNTTSEVIVEKTYKDPRYFANLFLNEPFYLMSGEITIIVPDWVQADFRNYNFSNLAINVTSERDNKKAATVYKYTFSNLQSETKESHKPGPTYIYPHILTQLKSASPDNATPIVYFKQAEDQYKWYKSLTDKLTVNESVIKNQALEITKNEKNDLDKIKAIYNWVQSNIRYVAFEDGIAGFKPENADVVLNKKYGDCKGMANLIKNLLKSIGLDARLCWLGTNHILYDYSTPSLAVDNHMICAVKLNEGFIFLDGTEKYIGFKEYAERIQNRQVMIENGELCILARIPEKQSSQNLLEEKRKVKLNGNNIAGSVEMVYKGESKQSFLAGYNTIKKQHQEQALENYLSDGDSKYGIQGLLVKNINDWNNDIHIQYSVNHKDAVAEFGDEKYLDIDTQKEFMNAEIDSARKTDYCFSYKYNISRNIEVDLPEKYRPASLPQPVVITNDIYSIQAAYKLESNKLYYTKEIIFNKARIPVEKIAQWNFDIKKLKSFYLEQITLKKTP